MQKLIFLYLFISVLSCYDYSTDCVCAPSSTFQGASLSVSSPTPIFSPEDEIINDVNYGKIVKFGTQIWLIKEVTAIKSITTLASNCPASYRLPTQPELEDLVALAGANSTNATLFLMNSSLFNFKDMASQTGKVCNSYWKNICFNYSLYIRSWKWSLCILKTIHNSSFYV